MHNSPLICMTNSYPCIRFFSSLFTNSNNRFSGLFLSAKRGEFYHKTKPLSSTFFKIFYFFCKKVKTKSINHYFFFKIHILTKYIPFRNIFYFLLRMPKIHQFSFIFPNCFPRLFHRPTDTSARRSAKIGLFSGQTNRQLRQRPFVGHHQQTSKDIIQTC